jgi:hypothetical protein
MPLFNVVYEVKLILQKFKGDVYYITKPAGVAQSV